MAGSISVSDLKPGDAFLYQSKGFLPDMIRLLDGEPYSHASIFLGAVQGTPSVAEMLGSGTNVRSVVDSLAGHNFVDAFRYINDAGQPLGSIGVDPAPLITKMDYFTDPANAQRYGYEQILLLAMLCSTRKVDGVTGEIVRRVLDDAAEIVADLVHAGKQPMICSELVYRCYTEAGPPYDLRIVGSDIPRQYAFAFYGLLPPGSELNRSAALASPSSEDAATASAISSYLANYAAAKGYFAKPENKTAVKMLEANPATAVSMLAVADFVTPNDLGHSPNLQILGRVAG